MNVRFEVSNFLRQKLGRGKARAFIRPVIHGYLDAISEVNVAGWMWNPYAPGTRQKFEIALTLPDGERVIAEGIADKFYPPLHHASVGDACYGFHVENSEKAECV